VSSVFGSAAAVTAGFARMEGVVMSVPGVRAEPVLSASNPQRVPAQSSFLRKPPFLRSIVMLSVHSGSVQDTVVFYD